MKYSQFIPYVKERLGSLYGSDECRSIALRLLEDICSVDKLTFASAIDTAIPDNFVHLLEKALEEMSKGTPLQYVTGFEWFYGSRFKVEKGVLIPRPETEELVDWICKEIKSGKDNNDKRVVLDIGCGSGAIGISIAHTLPNSSVYACDISECALEVSKYNAFEILGKGSSGNYSLFRCDILDLEESVKAFSSECGRLADIIVSNPPYICRSESAQMRRNVLSFEPDEALFVDDSNPFLFYNTIIMFSNYTLKPGGELFFEINERYGKDIVNIMKNSGFDGVELRPDFRGKARMIRGFKK